MRKCNQGVFVYFFIAFDNEKINITIPKVIKTLNKIRRIIPIFGRESNNVNSCCIWFHSLLSELIIVKRALLNAHELKI